MSSTEILTIAIPCYERKEFFLDALKSALNQTVKCKIIVVDNCSSHKFFEKECKKRGITYYRNETNIGLYPNYNKCYSLATTEYVKILDDDDILSPTYVESFLRAKELYPDVDIYYSDYVLLTTAKELPHSETLPFGYIEKGNEIIEYGINYRLAFPYMTSAIKKSKAQLDLDKNDCIGGYDYVWVYSKADQLSFFGDSEKLHRYRIHDGKASHQDKDWVANVLTAPYIYETILQPKISELKLKKKISKNIFWGLMLLKSFGNKREIQEIKSSENRFGRYLKVKLNNNILLKTVFMLPKSIVQIVFRIFRKMGLTL